MKIWPMRGEVIQTRLDVSDLEARLRAIAAHREFLGWVRNRTFSFSPSTLAVVHDGSPTITGRIVERPGGSDLHLRMRLSGGAILSLCAVVLMALFGFGRAFGRGHYGDLAPTIFAARLIGLLVWVGVPFVYLVGTFAIKAPRSRARLLELLGL